MRKRPRKISLPYEIVVAQKGCKGFRRTAEFDYKTMTICDLRFGKKLGKSVNRLIDAVKILCGRFKDAVFEPVYYTGSAFNDMRYDNRIITAVEEIEWTRTDTDNPEFEGVLIFNNGARMYTKTDLAGSFERVKLLQRTVKPVRETRKIPSHAKIVAHPAIKRDVPVTVPFNAYERRPRENIVRAAVM